MNNKRKMSIVIALVIILSIIGIGYAYLTTTLSINGTTDVDSNTWNVYWDNVQVKEGSVSATTPTITNQTSVSFSVHLSKPGDYYEFTVDAKNDGSIDAMIESIGTTVNNQPITNLPDYLEYRLTYSDGGEVEDNQLLESNKKETYKIYIKYKTNINPDQLPATNNAIDIGIDINYKQADSSAEERPHYLYYVGDQYLYFGNPIPNGITIYDNYQDAIDDYGDIYFIRFTTENDIIVKAYSGAIIDGKEYYIEGNNTDAYNSNKQVLLSAFDSSQCTESSNYMMCARRDIGQLGLRGYISDSGFVDFGDDYDDGGYCVVNENGFRCTR